MLQRRVKLIREFISRAAHAAAMRAAALDHELRNHAMENQAVVERPLLFLPGLFVSEFFRAFGQPDKVGYGLWRLFLQQAHHNVSLRSLENGVRSCRSAHAFSSRNNSSYTSPCVPRHLDDKDSVSGRPTIHERAWFCQPNGC